MKNVWPTPGSSPRESDSKTKLVSGLVVLLKEQDRLLFFVANHSIDRAEVPSVAACETEPAPKPSGGGEFSYGL